MSVWQRRFPNYFHIVYYARQRNTICEAKRNNILQKMHESKTNPAIIINTVMILKQKTQKKRILEPRRAKYLQVKIRLLRRRKRSKTAIKYIMFQILQKKTAGEEKRTAEKQPGQIEMKYLQEILDKAS